MENLATILNSVAIGLNAIATIALALGFLKLRRMALSVPPLSQHITKGKNKDPQGLLLGD